MGNFASLIGNSFGKQITDVLTWYIVPVLLGVVVLWALWMGWRLIRTAGAEARQAAKKQFHNAFALLAIFSAIFCVIAGTNLALSPTSARANTGGPSVVPSVPTNPGNYGAPGGIADGDPGSGPGDGPLGTPWISEFICPLEIKNRETTANRAGHLFGAHGSEYNWEHPQYRTKRPGQNGNAKQGRDQCHRQ